MHVLRVIVPTSWFSPAPPVLHTTGMEWCVHGLKIKVLHITHLSNLTAGKEVEIIDFQHSFHPWREEVYPGLDELLHQVWFLKIDQYLLILFMVIKKKKTTHPLVIHV